MNTLRGLLCLALLALTLLLPAQPSGNDSWLTVRVLTSDGAAFPGTPTVTLYRIDGKTRSYTGLPIETKDYGPTLIGLLPGKHEVRLALNDLGLIDAPKQIDLFPGPNLIEWRTPPLLPLSGELTRENTAQPAPTTARAYLMTVGKSGPMPIAVSLNTKGYRLRGVFPDQYRLLLLTDAGYGFTEFTANAEQNTGVSAPMTLRVGGVLDIEITTIASDSKVLSLPSATITLTNQVIPQFSPAITLYTNPQGKVSTLCLPPGQWNWTASFPGFKPSNGVVTVTAGPPQLLPISITPMKR